jgi:hypothetical protein
MMARNFLSRESDSFRLLGIPYSMPTTRHHGQTWANGNQTKDMIDSLRTRTHE